MKITRFEQRPQIKQFEMSIDPLYIWVGPKDRISIEKGDSLLEVASAVRKFWPLTMKQIATLVAYWFAMAVRIRDGCEAEPWNEEELMVTPHRQYLFDKQSKNRPNGKRRKKRSPR